MTLLPTHLPLAAVERGDWTFTAWVITLAYFAGAGLCFWAARREKDRSLGRARRWMAPTFWYSLFGLLLALGINKQFDFQSDLTRVGRRIAVAMGLYGERRIFQAIFVVVFALVAIAAVAWAAWYMRDLFKRYRLAFIGIIYLCAFVIIRAASFHHIDQILYHSAMFGWLVNTTLELGGIAMIAYAAWRAATEKESKQTYQSFERKVSIR
ncbi:MAG: hypothetical protein ACAI43_11325 [Phycisphaerae bacterium]|nr:hypothetical protein [Tepidisphaeraceae bacterium]